jgi:hypothetical protein
MLATKIDIIKEHVALRPGETVKRFVESPAMKPTVVSMELSMIIPTNELPPEYLTFKDYHLRRVRIKPKYGGATYEQHFLVETNSLDVFDQLVDIVDGELEILQAVAKDDGIRQEWMRIRKCNWWQRLWKLF